jgi:hypothetical protein
VRYGRRLGVSGGTVSDGFGIRQLLRRMPDPAPTI